MRFFTSSTVGTISQSNPSPATGKKKHGEGRAATTGSFPVPAPSRSLFEGGVRLAAGDLRTGPLRSQGIFGSDVIDDNRHTGPFKPRGEGLNENPVPRLTTNSMWSINPFIWLTRLAAKKTKKNLRNKGFELVTQLPDTHSASCSTGQGISSLIFVSPKENTDQKEGEIPNWAKPLIHASSHAPVGRWISRIHCWEMDIFEIQNVTTAPLHLIGLEIFQYHDLIGRLNLDEQR